MERERERGGFILLLFADWTRPLHFGDRIPTVRVARPAWRPSPPPASRSHPPAPAPARARAARPPPRPRPRRPGVDRDEPPRRGRGDADHLTRRQRMGRVLVARVRVRGEVLREDVSKGRGDVHRRGRGAERATRDGDARDTEGVPRGEPSGGIARGTIVHRHGSPRRVLYTGPRTTPSAW
jgi:hypothetical protein